MFCALINLRLAIKDRVYTKTAGVPEIWDAGFLLFVKHIIRPPIQGHLVSAILIQIQTERDGYVINRSAVKGCVDVLRELKEIPDGPTIYRRDLEPAILRESETFYKTEGERLLEICDAPEYLQRVRYVLLCLLRLLIHRRLKVASTPKTPGQTITCHHIPLILFAKSWSAIF